MNCRMGWPPHAGDRSHRHNSVEDRVATLKAGFTLHLAKPIETQRPRRVLKSLLGDGV